MLNMQRKSNTIRHKYFFRPENYPVRLCLSRKGTNRYEHHNKIRLGERSRTTNPFPSEHNTQAYSHRKAGGNESWKQVPDHGAIAH
jgi:hypothetical protein